MASMGLVGQALAALFVFTIGIAAIALVWLFVADYCQTRSKKNCIQ